METRLLIEKLEAEKLALRAKMAASDGRAAKCGKMGLAFAETYPQDYQEYMTANKRYNEVEAELVPLYEQLEREEAEEHHRPEEE